MRLANGILARPAFALTALILCLAMTPATAQAQGDYVVLSWNDLGIHVMDPSYENFLIHPPYNTLYAQVIRVGDGSTPPEIVTTGITVEYSIPGNSYSAGKTNFWDYAEVRDATRVELARSNPVIPVSTEMNCLQCHGTETDIVTSHGNVPGYSSSATPIYCTGCHWSPLTGPPECGACHSDPPRGDPDYHQAATGRNPGAGYYSERGHSRHDFIDNMTPGIEGCRKCHPGPETQALRGTMANDFGMICQDCHGTMQDLHESIAAGRVPFDEEPSCRECHTATYGEPEGQLYRHSAGHGGVMCAACHGSPHAIYPSREDRDNANHVALQGHVGTLTECAVCHGVPPADPGPHGLNSPTGIVEEELSEGALRLASFPNPMRLGQGMSCTFEARGAVEPFTAGRALVYDANGRAVRLLRPAAAGDGAAQIVWDGRDTTGKLVSAGVYFVQWKEGDRKALGKVVVMN